MLGSTSRRLHPQQHVHRCKYLLIRCNMFLQLAMLGCCSRRNAKIGRSSLDAGQLNNSSSVSLDSGRLLGTKAVLQRSGLAAIVIVGLLKYDSEIKYQIFQ